MNELFGVSMNIIAGVSIALTTVILLLVALIAVRNPVMFKMGLRNIPRRPAQTTLIIIGLMLSTVIVTAAFGTGDTMDHSITAEVYQLLGEGDELIQFDRDLAAPEDQRVIPLSLVDELKNRFAGSEHIEAFIALNSERMPVLDLRTKLNSPSPRIVGFRPEEADDFGGLKDLDGNPVTLAVDEIAVNEKLADEIDAEPGDTVKLVFNQREEQLKVKAIVPNTLLAGTWNTAQREGAAVNFEFLARLTGKGAVADGVFVSNQGGPREGWKVSDAAVAELEQALEGHPYEVEPVKQDGIEQAEMFGNFFTTFFVIFGLFSIAAGVLLIFLIFVMLAAERKPEMGMARAVGAKRRQIVESFLAEGFGYDLGAALVGLAAGVGVVFAMIGILNWFVGDAMGLVVQVNVTPRSLAVSFCLGIIATFIVIFFASWRASRINIVSAIRDLPESRPINPEAATWLGYLRGTLNGMVAFGFVIVSLVGMARIPALLPLFALVGVFGLIGPWIYVLRGANFGASIDDRLEGERAPVWPWVLGIVLLPLMGLGLVVLLGYALAMLLVRLTRDRRPSGMPTWLLVAGIIVAPIGLVLAPLQDRKRRIPWSVGFGVVGLIVGVLFVNWGLDSDKMFFFASGISLVLLWIAVSLRYFHVAERASFTITSAVLLVAWYLTPSGRLEWLVGELDGDFEMFFLSGITMITAGTFIVVYNADILLPLISRGGASFGRIFPAVKMAVAYPLTSRFRTGMTVAMIGLIMFSLVMFQTMNANFVAVFLGDKAKGGFDGQAVMNTNNHVDDLIAALKEGGANTSGIASATAMRVAFPFEAQIVDPTPEKDDDGVEQPYGRLMVQGVDDDFFNQTNLEFNRKAKGYDTPRDIWDAMARDHTLAVVPTSAFNFQDGGPPIGFDPLDLGDMPDEGFEPFPLTLHDPGSGKDTTVTVIGVAQERADIFFWGIILAKETLLSAYSEASGQTWFYTVNEGVDPTEVAKTIESTLIQASADSFDELLDEQQRQQQGFLYIFQGFMGLGLLVGIAALGVIASRAVVERRQQIGMLRAIGYKRRLVALSFLFESSFISLSGILLGFVLAISLSWVLFTSGSMDESAGEVAFRVPWLSVFAICAVAFFASLMMTFLPARSASKVAVAEALRYE